MRERAALIPGKTPVPGFFFLPRVLKNVALEKKENKDNV